MRGREEMGMVERKKLSELLKPEYKDRIEEIDQEYMDRMVKDAEEAEKEATVPISVRRGRLYK